MAETRDDESIRIHIVHTAVVAKEDVGTGTTGNRVVSFPAKDDEGRGGARTIHSVIPILGIKGKGAVFVRRQVDRDRVIALPGVHHCESVELTFAPRGVIRRVCGVVHGQVVIT